MAFAGCCLLAMVFMGSCRDHATICRKTPTMLALNSLEVAISLFHSEYGRLPAGESFVRTDGAAGSRLISVLLGSETGTGEKENPRGIRFLNLREGKNGKNGLEYDSKAGAWLVHDEWGHPYTIILNTGKEDPWLVTHGNRKINCGGSLAFIYSPGPDGKAGTADDVTTGP